MPPLDGVHPSDMIDIGVISTNFFFDENKKFVDNAQHCFAFEAQANFSRLQFEFSLKVKVMGSNPDYLLIYFPIYNSSMNWRSEHTVINWNLSTVRFSEIRFTPLVLSLRNKPAVIWDWYLQDQGIVTLYFNKNFDFSRQLKA